ncbi:MAG: hypothetical protein WCP29_02410 [Acidobacteriota bacterium]
MYSDFGTFGLVLGVHSVVRWLVLGLGVGASVRAWIGRTTARPWTEADTRIGRMFAACLDLQIGIGAVLYGVFSPVVAAGMSNLAVATNSRAYRFWLLEHPLSMIAAAVLAHVGLSRARRTNSPASHRYAAMYFTMALLILLAAIPWPIFTFGRALWPSR